MPYQLSPLVGCIRLAVLRFLAQNSDNPVSATSTSNIPEESAYDQIETKKKAARPRRPSLTTHGEGACGYNFDIWFLALRPLYRGKGSQVTLPQWTEAAATPLLLFRATVGLKVLLQYVVYSSSGFSLKPASPQLHHLWVRRQIVYQVVFLSPISKNPEDGGIASLPAIPALALSFSPPESSLLVVARIRWSPKRLAPQTQAFLPHQASSRTWTCSITADPWNSHGARPSRFALECSSAPHGVGLKSLYHVYQPQDRGKSRRGHMRETSHKRDPEREFTMVHHQERPSNEPLGA